MVFNLVLKETEEVVEVSATNNLGSLWVICVAFIVIVWVAILLIGEFKKYER